MYRILYSISASSYSSINADDTRSYLFTWSSFDLNILESCRKVSSLDSIIWIQAACYLLRPPVFGFLPSTILALRELSSLRQDRWPRSHSWQQSDFEQSYFMLLQIASSHIRALRHTRPILLDDMSRMTSTSVVRPGIDYANCFIHGPSNTKKLQRAQKLSYSNSLSQSFVAHPAPFLQNYTGHQPHRLKFSTLADKLLTSDQPDFFESVAASLHSIYYYDSVNAPASLAWQCHLNQYIGNNNNNNIKCLSAYRLCAGVPKNNNNNNS